MINRQQRWQLKKKAEGLCTKCGEPNDQEVSLCRLCATKDSISRSEKYEQKNCPMIRGKYKSKYKPKGDYDELG